MVCPLPPPPPRGQNLGRPQGRAVLSMPWGPSQRHHPASWAARHAMYDTFGQHGWTAPSRMPGKAALVQLRSWGGWWHVPGQGGSVSGPAAPPVGLALGSLSLPAGASSTRQHTTPPTCTPSTHIITRTAIGYRL